jgi:hypothetical protein
VKLPEVAFPPDPEIAVPDGGACVGERRRKHATLTATMHMVTCHALLARHHPCARHTRARQHPLPAAASKSRARANPRRRPAGGECGVVYERRLRMPQPPGIPSSKLPLYYSYTIGPMAIISLSTEQKLNPGSLQYTWVWSCPCVYRCLWVCTHMCVGVHTHMCVGVHTHMCVCVRVC